MELRNVSAWRSTLGYLPVPLQYGEAKQRFVMLNGAKGNFCLDIANEDIARKDQRDIAWSSDVDHYVRISDERVQVLRWDIPQPVESSVSDVINNLVAFQQYLESTRAPRDQSVVAHAVTTYNRIRAALPEGAQGLQAFLYALHTSLTRQLHNAAEIQWEDEDSCAQSWASITSSSRDRILDDFRNPRASDKSPDIGLMLRHAMGRIFQEAHNLVALSPQMSLLGDGELITLGSTARTSGAYFTPTPLVRTLVEQCLTPEMLARPSLVVLDAACGSGEFLRECVRQLDLNGYEGRVTVVGFDVSLPAVLMARFALATETARHGNRVTTSIAQSDALLVEWPQGVDICLMNPPYASWSSLSPSARKRLSDVLGNLTRSRPDLAFGFMTKAARCLNAGGMLGAVIPASLLDGESAAPLREELDDLLNRRVIVRLGNQSIFDEAMVDASLYVAQRHDAEPQDTLLPTLMVWADHTSGAADRALRALRSLGHAVGNDPIEMDRPGFSIYTAATIRAPKMGWAPRPHGSRKLLDKLTSLPKLTEFYEIKQGTITGLNSAFLLTSEDFKRLPRSERRFFRRAVVNVSIIDGALHEGHWVFYPYGVNLPALDSEEALETALPVYLERFLQPNRAGLVRRAGMDRNHWWDLTRRRSVHERSTPKLVSTYFGSAGSFAWDATGEFVVVQGYVWMPKHTELDNERIGHAMVAVLGSATAEHLVAAVSNNLAGGQFNLSARFMGKMPFVDMRDERLGDLVDALALIGTAMATRSQYSPELRDKLASDLFTSAVLGRQ